MIELIGKSQPVKRLITGLYSFDRAFINANGEIGFPLNKGVEIVGNTHVGKSTLVYSLAGRIAKLQGNRDIDLCDLEGFDPEFVIQVLSNSGFDGKVLYIQEDEDEEALDSLIVHLKDKNSCVGILDSIGAISPLAEQSGSLGEANMGKRAFLMAQFSRKALRVLLNSPDGKTIFAINHQYPIIGGRGKTTPGGQVKNYLFTIRIEVARRYLKNKYEEFPDGSYIIEGKVIKNRWGIKDRKFHLFVLAGYGIHDGLTAMYDLIDLELVSRGRTLKMDGISFGTIKEVIMKAHSGDMGFFAPFIEKIKTITFTNITNDELADAYAEEDKESEEE